MYCFAAAQRKGRPELPAIFDRSLTKVQSLRTNETKVPAENNFS